MQEKGGGLKDDRTLHGSCVYSSHLYHLVLHVLMGTLHTRAMQSRIILQGPLGEVRGGGDRGQDDWRFWRTGEGCNGSMGFYRKVGEAEDHEEAERYIADQNIVVE